LGRNYRKREKKRGYPDMERKEKSPYIIYTFIRDIIYKEPLFLKFNM